MKLLALVYVTVGWMPILVLAASPFPWSLSGTVLLALMMIGYWLAIEELGR
jgi:hypothetical protein